MSPRTPAAAAAPDTEVSYDVGPGAGRPNGAPAPGASRAGAALLPALALAWLAAGGACWLWARPGVAARVWYAGLVLTGSPVAWRTLRDAFRGHFATDLVAALAIVGAVLLGEPLAGLVVVLMQTGGEALERYAAGRASAAVRALEAAAPRIAHRVLAGGDGAAAGLALDDVPVDAVRVGDVLLVRPGELVPCDAEVVDGRSHVDASRLTGEPVPVAAAPGVRLLSGSANGEGTLTVRALAPASESQYARIVELVRSAQASKAPLQRIADRYAVWFTPATLLVCAAAWAVSGDPARALAVLVVATPCPLILATPVAIIGGINRAARAHVIVRHGGALEQLGAVTAAVFDKTGTLTVGRPEVARVVTADGWGERDVLRLAGAVEQGSGHLLARTLVQAAQAAEAARHEAGAAALPAAAAVVEAPGRGVRGVVDGHGVAVGARAYVADLVAERYPGIAADLAALDGRLAQGPLDAGLRAYVAVDGRAAAVVEYADRVRDAARRVLDELRALGVRRTLLLSGDRAPNVRAVAAAVGITDAAGDLLPEDKVRAVRALAAAGERVLMVGDGTNDAPALSSATVGVALAAHGGGISAEAADVIVLDDDLARVAEAVRIGRRTVRIARQSIGVGLGLSGAAMVVAAFGYIRPAVGALLQEAIDVAVILNALRTSR